MHQQHLSSCFPFGDGLSSWGLLSEFMHTAGHCCPIRPCHHSKAALWPCMLSSHRATSDPWLVTGFWSCRSASGSTAVVAEGCILGPQLGSRVTAGLPRQRPSGEPGPDTDVAVQQLKGRAVGGATFEAMPISGLKMYATPVKLSSFQGTRATNLGSGRSCQYGEK